MPAFVIFVEGTDTEPAKLPVYIVESEERASLICEGMKESDYHIFDFSFKHCTRSDRGKFAVWATMICDARDGVYGNIVGGIYKMIDGAYSIMSGRRSPEKIASGAATETGNGDSTTHAKQADETADLDKRTPVETPRRFVVHHAAWRMVVDEHEGTDLTDREVYNWLKEHGGPEGYELPPEFKTWQNYVSKGRCAAGEGKHQRRVGVPSRTGSFMPVSELDSRDVRE